MSEIKERPILFSGEMVKAILAGQKTMTRRVVKPVQSKPKVAPLEMEPWIIDGYWEEDDDGRPYWAGSHPDYPTGKKWFTCPYGKSGERLWVRETWALSIPVGASIHAARVPIYRADEGEQAPKWKPSIFMPRWASRLTLEIAGVKVERLQDISEEDAKAEGVLPDTRADCDHPRQSCEAVGCMGPGYRAPFAELWDTINGKGSWESNPFVWCISFRRIEGEP